MLDRAIEMLAQCAALMRCWCVLDPYERGLVLRLGRYQRRIGPGLHWLIPGGVDRVLHDNVVPRIMHLPAQTLITSDGTTVCVTAVVTFRIASIRKALLGVEGIHHAIADACTTSVACHVSATTLEVLRNTSDSSAIAHLCQRYAKQYGIAVIRVQLADISPCRVIRLYTTPQERPCS